MPDAPAPDHPSPSRRASPTTPRGPPCDRTVDVPARRAASWSKHPVRQSRRVSTRSSRSHVRIPPLAPTPGRARHRPKPIIRLTLLPLLLIATAAGAQPGGARAEVRVERVLSLGGDEGAREAVLVDVADVATGPAGELYVLDAGDR